MRVELNKVIDYGTDESFIVAGQELRKYTFNMKTCAENGSGEINTIIYIYRNEDFKELKTKLDEHIIKEKVVLTPHFIDSIFDECQEYSSVKVFNHCLDTGNFKKVLRHIETGLRYHYSLVLTFEDGYGLENTVIAIQDDLMKG